MEEYDGIIVKNKRKKERKNQREKEYYGIKIETIKEMIWWYYGKK